MIPQIRQGTVSTNPGRPSCSVDPRTEAATVGRVADSGGVRGLRPRHLAGRAEGPVPVEPDDAPFDAEARANHAGRLPDRVVHRVLQPIRNQRKRATEAAGDGVWRPRPISGLANFFEAVDGEIGIPEAALLLGKIR